MTSSTAMPEPAQHGNESLPSTVAEQELLAAAQAWADDDPDAHTAAQLRELIRLFPQDDRARAELISCFATQLGFGTAGLRAALGPGPNRMNSAVVMRAAAALGKFLFDLCEGDQVGLVVVGYDARHNSAQFARDTCEVLSGAGVPVAVMPEHCPTPVLAFAVAHLAAAAGVMVTASHNPAADNGYKVYLGPGSGLDYRGSQIVPPVDARIAQLISAIDCVRELPRGDEWLTLNESVTNAYREHTVAVVTSSGPRDLCIVHTAMHGVGTSMFRSTTEAVGFLDVHEVAEQALPNPDFPTVAFPNPEEPGALDLAFAYAQSLAADVVIAHDPDADRCAVALPVAPPVDSAVSQATMALTNTEQRNREKAPAPDNCVTWKRLSGDDVGLLLGWWRIAQARTGTRPLPEDAVFASSIVSGSLLERLCQREGITHERTLTGFKWLARISNLTYGYEEALGYCVNPESVRDKDGISASLSVLECIAHLKQQGVTAWALLAQLRDELGGAVTHNEAFATRDAATASAIMTELTSAPPTHLAGIAIVGVDDLATGVDGLPPTTGLRWRLASSDDAPSRVIIRPSGTEAKLKCYVEAATEERAHAVAADCGRLITERQRFASPA